jgi:RNA polymerase sigma-70 factor (ECF subfamily)
MTGQAIAMTAAAGAAEPAPAERLARLFDAHHARLYRLARRMVPTAEEARDAVQDTFLRAARSPRSIPDHPAQEEAWLVRVLINICRDGWRKQAVRRRYADAPAAVTDHRAAESALVARSTVWRALDALSPRRRAIIVLYEIEGASIPSIAQLLGITSVTVRWHLSVGRRELAHVVGTLK